MKLTLWFSLFTQVLLFSTRIDALPPPSELSNFLDFEFIVLENHGGKERGVEDLKFVAQYAIKCDEIHEFVPGRPHLTVKPRFTCTYRKKTVSACGKRQLSSFETWRGKFDVTHRRLKNGDHSFMMTEDFGSTSRTIIVELFPKRPETGSLVKKASGQIFDKRTGMNNPIIGVRAYGLKFTVPCEIWMFKGTAVEGVDRKAVEDFLRFTNPAGAK